MAYGALPTFRPAAVDGYAAKEAPGGSQQSMAGFSMSQAEQTWVKPAGADGNTPEIKVRITDFGGTQQGYTMLAAPLLMGLQPGGCPPADGLRQGRRSPRGRVGGVRQGHQERQDHRRCPLPVHDRGRGAVSSRSLWPSTRWPRVPRPRPPAGRRGRRRPAASLIADEPLGDERHPHVPDAVPRHAGPDGESPPAVEPGPQDPVKRLNGMLTRVAGLPAAPTMAATITCHPNRPPAGGPRRTNARDRRGYRKINRCRQVARRPGPAVSTNSPAAGAISKSQV